ncbi:MAG: cob(I)yrinic acid a,c-diamide adenosyltransferase [Planctomycetia bacterium]|nr:cob(I)yrinic acid a,c-diamide adenosyltransferase [Planctomycetia bacterium]
MKIYTKTGDAGETGLFGGPRVAKDHVRIEAYGTVDELNAVIGWARTAPLPADVDALLARVQNELFEVGAELATPDATEKKTATIGERHIAVLEQSIDKMEETLAPLKQFILPGGSNAAARLHLARTVCRRAERRVVTLMQTPGESVSQSIVIYLNRLSDLLFVAARFTNAAARVPDTLWEKPTSADGSAS